MHESPSHQNPAVFFENVTFSYASLPVLENVNLTIPPLESICIVGPNGGGKTTLLKLILGALKPDRGRVRVFGSPPDEALMRVGYVPQYAHYDPQFPVTSINVVLMGRLGEKIGGFYTKEDRNIAFQALETMNLEKMANELFANLSGGQRQRVLIARALAGDSDLLILDEPTANIDVESEIHFFELLRQLSLTKTILMVTHDVGFASKLFQTIACVNKNVTIHSTTNLTGTVIKDLYGHEMHMIHHDHRCLKGGLPCD